MKKESVNKTMYISVLDYEIRIEIKKLLEQALIKMDFSGNELDQHLENGLDSRLCDLEETIDIYNLKTVKVI